MNGPGNVFRPVNASPPAQTTPTPTKAEDVSIPEPKTDLAPTLYTQEKGKPYLSVITETENIYTDLDTDLKEHMEMIDEHYQTLVKSEQYDNNPESYKELLKKLERVTDTKHAPLRVKMGKIAEYIRYINRSKHYGS